jgi:cytochrome oxidase Cu insertion factor (SCO1/SenC/PrrC family)
MQNSKPTLLPSTPRLVVAIVLLAVAAVLGFYAWNTAWIEKTVSGVALIGGPFEMVDQNGTIVTEKNFAGKPMLLFFGYTYCPDVCPTELQILSAALDQLGEQAKTVQPIFVSIDPERDTPAVLKSYLEGFGPRWIGLTGTPEQVRQITRSWHVFYEKRDNKASPQDYLMDHSSFIFLMGSDGHFLKHFNYTTDAKTLAADLSNALKSGS